LREVAVRHLHRARPAREAPAYFRDHQVPHRKVNARVTAIDFPTLCAHKSSRAVPVCLNAGPYRNRKTKRVERLFSFTYSSTTRSARLGSYQTDRMDSQFEMPLGGPDARHRSRCSRVTALR